MRVVILKPSKYDRQGHVERFRRGFMPNTTLPWLRSLTPERVGGLRCEVHAVDEYVRADLDYLSLLRAEPGVRTLVALVGVQSHQMHRALDLAALALDNGVECTVVGGPHPMTCDTGELQGKGVSFSLAEAERVWPAILEDATRGELRPTYGTDGRWQQRLDPPVLVPPSRRTLRRYAVPMLGVYPARGCPFRCNFCSVIKIAGRRIRSQPVETTLASLKAAQEAGVRYVMFTSDNLNKYPEIAELLEAMIEARIRLPFFAQCDTQIHQQEDLVELLARAGCFQVFIGVESFSRKALRAAGKLHNRPQHYARIVELCRAHGITTHFSNILGFPDDTRASVLEHLARLREVGPDLASFYILTPIPGTEQYDDFLARGLITEDNLDRFDGLCATWRHPHLEADELQDLLLLCYRRFYAGRDVLGKLLRLPRTTRDARLIGALHSLAGYSALSRLAVSRRQHPMAGGAFRVRLDHERDYLPARRRRFGLEQVSLPRSLELGEADRRLEVGAPASG